MEVKKLGKYSVPSDGYIVGEAIGGSNEYRLFVEFPKGDRKEIEIEDSQVIRNHSDGFSCGYLGSGCSQTALAILFELTSDVEFSKKYYMEFKEDYVANINPRPEDGTWTIPIALFQGWIYAKQESK